MEKVYDQFMVDYIDDVANNIVNTIVSTIRNKIVTKVVARIATLFTPVGALIGAVRAGVELYRYLRDNFKKYINLAMSIIDNVHAIAMGDLSAAIAGVESTLANALKTSYDLIESLIKIVEIAKPTEIVVEALDKVQKPISKAIRAAFEA